MNEERQKTEAHPYVTKQELGKNVILETWPEGWQVTVNGRIMAGELFSLREEKNRDSRLFLSVLQQYRPIEEL